MSPIALLAPLALQIVIDPPHPPRPVPRPILNPQVQLVQERVTVRIVDGAATTELEQTFYNAGDLPGEQVFLFPIPPDTAVTHLTLTMDGKPVASEVLDKDKARQIYNDIVRQRRDPALLEYAGHGLIRASIFPVPPRGEAKMALKYTTVLRPAAGLYDYSFPLRIAEIAAGALRSISFDLRIESSKPIQSIHSPSHKIDVSRDGDRKARVGFEGGRDALGRDFRLVYGISDSEFGVHLMPFRKATGEGYFLLFLAPKHEIPQGKVQPKDIVFVLDSSGSMAGEKMRQAKEALKFCLNRLGRSDRFNVIRFSTEAEKFRETLAEANPENVAQALAFVDAIEARGGTNIHEALEKALGCRTETEGFRLFMTCFLTDGLPTVGVTDVDSILASVRARNAAGARIFTFGVGDDVNTRLLDTIAEETRAARAYVRPNENIEVAVSNFYDQVSMPVLANPTLAVEGVEIYDFHPKRLPDLFKGTQLALVGRFRGEGRARIRLSGRVGDEGREWIYEADFSSSDSRNDFIPALWATRKVGYLLDEIRLHGSSAELVAEVTRLGKEYGIVTPYTSHLVIEEQMRVAGDFRRVRGDVVLPPMPSGPADEVREAERRLKALGEKSPSAESGAAAVAQSQTIGSLKKDGSDIGASISGIETKRIGEKVFLRVGEYWIDSSLTQETIARAKKVAFLSDEYFRLLEDEPGLERVLSLGQKLLVEWKGSVYEIS